MKNALIRKNYKDVGDLVAQASKMANIPVEHPRYAEYQAQLIKLEDVIQETFYISHSVWIND